MDFESPKFFAICQTVQSSPLLARPPGRREQRRAEIRARIAAAALRVFGREGYGVCTVEDLLCEAEVSRATFYQHFTGKADVAQAVIAAMWSHAEGMYRGFSQLQQADTAAIRRWLDDVDNQWLAWSVDMGTILRELPGELSRGLTEHRQALVLAVIGDGRHWRALSADEARRRATLLTLQLERVMQELHLQGLEEDTPALLDTLASFWSSALKP